MTPSDIPPRFSREMGCTAAELCGWLPLAVGTAALQLGADQALVALEGGPLHLSWQALPPHQIALLRLPRLAVHFHFDGVADAERLRFMRRFDLVTQRGGG